MKALKTKKNPKECGQLAVDTVRTYRFLDCTDYDHCLDVAVEKEWQGFHCLNCSQFESEVFIMTDDEIINEIMDFLKEHELPQKNTVYNSANCGILVEESVKGLFCTINDLKKEKECTVKVRKSKADRNLIYNRFLEEWNDHGVIKHKKITTRMKKAIDKVVKNADYPLTEVFKAFENYAEILYSPGHFWDYKWTMDDFLIRGLHKFVDEAQPFDNNKKDIEPKSKPISPYVNFSCGG